MWWPAPASWRPPRRSSGAANSRRCGQTAHSPGGKCWPLRRRRILECPNRRHRRVMPGERRRDLNHAACKSMPGRKAVRGQVICPRHGSVAHHGRRNVQDRLGKLPRGGWDCPVDRQRSAAHRGSPQGAERSLKEVSWPNSLYNHAVRTMTWRLSARRMATRPQPCSAHRH